MSDFLDAKRREIDDRLKELRPVVDEYRRLETAAAALEAAVGAVEAVSAAEAPSESAPRATRGRRAATRRRAGTRAASPRAASATPRRPGRRRGTGTRAAEALQYVEGQPGITIPELAGKMGIKQNYLYRVLPGLESEGKVRKDGRGWHPVSAAA